MSGSGVVIQVGLKDNIRSKLGSVDIDEIFLESITEEARDMNMKCLPFVDFYGETFFNGDQSKEIVKECGILKSKLRGEEVLDALEKIKDLAIECSKSMHTQLVFTGN
jgi:hypothetical protein